MRRFAALIVGLVLAAAACSNGDGSADGTPDADGTGGDRALSALDLPEVPSAGCDTTDPLPSGDSEQTLESGGVERTYLLSIPSAYDAATPLPVVVDFHGYAEGAAVQTRMSEMRTLGESEGFITVTPQGTGDIPLWNFTAGGSDVAFGDDLLDSLESSLCVDRSQVFAAGLSNGAMMSSTLACTTADRFAAVSPVAGILAVDDCAADVPMPAIIFHGTEDQFVPFDGGIGTAAQDLPTADGGTIGAGGQTGSNLDDVDADGLFGTGTVEDRARVWAERNGCDGKVSTHDVSGTVERWTYAGCPYDGRVVLYVVEGGGHAWPGSEFSASIESVVGHTTMDIDATELMWEFFSEQRREIVGEQAA